MWHSKEEPKTARELEIIYLLLSRLLREEDIVSDFHHTW